MVKTCDSCLYCHKSICGMDRDSNQGIFTYTCKIYRIWSNMADHLIVDNCKKYRRYFKRV